MARPDIQELARMFPQISGLTHLDSGGQKVVLAGQHPTFGDIVLKITDKINERVLREINIVTTKKFPGVPMVYDWGTQLFNSADILYLIEERVQGRSLREIINNIRVLDFQKAVNLLEFLLESAAIFESEHLVHRDIKPENIMIANNGQFFLLDFGIARVLDQTSLTATAAQFGPATLGYAAPEQFRNMKKAIDSRADLFSIGVVFYETITGVNPFIQGSNSPFDIIKRIEGLHLQKLDFIQDKTGELAMFAEILMQKWPSRRPRSAGEALEWFQRIKSGLEWI